MVYVLWFNFPLVLVLKPGNFFSQTSCIILKCFFATVKGIFGVSLKNGVFCLVM